MRGSQDLHPSRWGNWGSGKWSDSPWSHRSWPLPPVCTLCPAASWKGLHLGRHRRQEAHVLHSHSLAARRRRTQENTTQKPPVSLLAEGGSAQPRATPGPLPLLLRKRGFRPEQDSTRQRPRPAARGLGPIPSTRRAAGPSC